MTEKYNFRLERLNKLFREIEYEIHRGVMEGELDERIGYQFTMPSRQEPNKVLRGRFETRLIHPGDMGLSDLEPSLLRVGK